MRIFEVEIIKYLKERGEFKEFKRYDAARRFALKESLKPGVIETWLSGTDEDDHWFEVSEFYEKGVQSSLSPKPHSFRS